MAISRSIKRLRMERDWTQEPLAREDERHEVDSHRGGRPDDPPRMGAVEKLAAVFGISTSDMVNDQSEPSAFIEVPLYRVYRGRYPHRDAAC